MNSTKYFSVNSDQKSKLVESIPFIVYGLFSNLNQLNQIYTHMLFNTENPEEKAMGLFITLGVN
jgi:hypothetical protein